MRDEMKNKVMELSDEEIGQATGGIIPDDGQATGTATCPNCGHSYQYTITEQSYKIPNCPECGYNPN